MKTNVEFHMNKDGIIVTGGFEYKDYDKSFTPQVMTEVKDFPEAYDALATFFKKSANNKPYYDYKITHQFLCCRHGQLDYNSVDIDDNGVFHSEPSICAVASNCPFGKKVCMGKRSTGLTKMEMKVIELLCQNMDKAEISDKLCIAVNTVNNHLGNAYKRINVHDKAELFAFVAKHDLFPLS